MPTPEQTVSSAHIQKKFQKKVTSVRHLAV